MTPAARKRIAQLAGHAAVIAITLAMGFNPLLVLAFAAAGGLVSGGSRVYFEERNRRMVGELLEFCSIRNPTVSTDCFHPAKESQRVNTYAPPSGGPQV